MIPAIPSSMKEDFAVFGIPGDAVGAAREPVIAF